MSSINIEKYDVEDIYKKALEGDNKAWEVVQSWISRIIRKTKLGLRGETHSDLVQIALTILWYKIKQGRVDLKNPKSFISYLFTLSRNGIIDYSRSRSMRTRLNEIPIVDLDPEPNSNKRKFQIHDPSPDQESLMDTVVKGTCLSECMEKLNEEKRRLLFLKIREEAGLLTAEEAQELAATKNLAVKYSRLRKKIKECVEEKLSELEK